MIDVSDLAAVVIGRVRPGSVGRLPVGVTIGAHYDRFVAAVIGLAVSGLGDDYDQVVERVVCGCLELGRAHIAEHAVDDDGLTEAVAAYCGATYFAAWLAGTAVAVWSAEDELTSGDAMLPGLITPIVRWLGHLPGDSLVGDAPLTAGMRLRRHITTLGYLHAPAGRPLSTLAKVAMAGLDTRMAAIGHLTVDLVSTLGARGDDASTVLSAAARQWRPSLAPRPHA